MLTKEQIESLGLSMAINDKAVLTINAAFEFITENTTIDTTDIENLPACARLFMVKYCEISEMRAGVVSESIEGLSQSFSNGNKTALVWDLANDLFGDKMKSCIRFVAAERKWK